MDANKHNNDGGLAADELEAINAALGDLDIEEVVQGDVIEELELAPESDHATLEAIEAQAEIYAEQEATSTAAIVVPAPVAPAKAGKTKVASKTPGSTTPRAARDLTALPDAAFVLTTTPPADLSANKVDVLKTRPLQKKIAEKFDNTLSALNAGKAPSTYVMDCFRILDAKNEVTSTELVNGLKAISRKDGVQNYTDGTARSQAGQIMELFKVLQIATRAKQTLTLNPDSALAAQLRKFV